MSTFYILLLSWLAAGLGVAIERHYALGTKTWDDLAGWLLLIFMGWLGAFVLAAHYWNELRWKRVPWRKGELG